MDQLKLYTVKSLINQDMELLNKHFFESLEHLLGIPVKLVDAGDMGTEDFCIVYIASGGSEIQFLELMKLVQARRIYLLTSGYSNSLAAAMEILSYIKAKGLSGKIIHGSLEEVTEKLRRILRIERAVIQMRRMRFGLVGAPSDWLIASITDRDLASSRLGIEIMDIPMQELLREFERHEYVPNKWTEQLKKCDFDEGEVEKALYVYGAMKRLAEKYGLSGLSVRCFDLLGAIKTTGCLGMAILNAEGIYGGCEGDMPSLISMAILGEVSGEPVFMCNPSRIDTQNNEMIFAHCTLPLNMPYEMKLMTHFESRIGVAVSGAIPEEAFTIFKASNNLERYYVETGIIKENMHDETLCRSQIRVELPEYRYFTEKPINNHHLVCLGNWVKDIEDFFDLIR